MNRLCIVLALATGCALPLDVASEVEGVRVTAEPEDGALVLRLANESAVPITLGREVLAIDAREADGTFGTVETLSAWQFWERDEDVVAVGPGETLELRTRYPSNPLGTPRPGSYRARVSFARDGAPDEVGFEFTTVGWSETVGVEAQGFLQRAEELECHGLARRMEQVLLGRLEPDPLVSLHRGREGEPRTRAALEMLQRGGFTDVLGEELDVAPLDAVRPIADALSRREAPHGLRRSAALRMSELLVHSAAVDDLWDLRTLAQLSDDWSALVVDRFIARVRRGPEEGAVEVELIDTLVYAQSDLLDPRGPEILSAAEARCEGADGELAEACERLTSRFSPGLGGFGRGWGGSYGCGFSFDPPECGELEGEWSAFVQQAGALETLVF